MHRFLARVVPLPLSAASGAVLEESSLHRPPMFAQPINFMLPHGLGRRRREWHSIDFVMLCQTTRNNEKTMLGPWGPWAMLYNFALK